MASRDLVEGSVLLSAIGDAWGAGQELIEDNCSLQQKFDDPLEGSFPSDARITDDTQMSLTVASVIAAHKEFFDSYTVGNKEAAQKSRLLFTEGLLDWFDDDDNTSDRFPDDTSLSAMVSVKEARADSGEVGLNGFEGTHWNSKGCGANVRASWIGLNTDWSLEKIAAIARDQALVTHGHQLATLSASLTAMVTRGLATGDIEPGNILDRARDADYIGILPEKEAVARMLSYIHDISVEKDSYIVLNPDFNMCALYGSGWNAEEAFVLAALITDMFMSRGVNRKNAINAVKRAAFITGDSDSVAFIVGAFVGAMVGAHEMPIDWVSVNLEPRYQEELKAAVDNIASRGEHGESH